MQYNQFFIQATGIKEGPYHYQKKLADEPWPDLLTAPTGMGKTAAVVLAWLYKRRKHDPDTPRRLVYCMPMRTWAEQIEYNVREWLNNLELGGEAGDGKITAHLLTGGESDTKSWVEFPEEEMIILGTQDMLLSRALMRGYGMSRYQWPVQFALLHNDCMWVYDEGQLMGAGLSTSAQLEAFRRTFPLAKSSRSLWVSAALKQNWLETVDLKPRLELFLTLGISAADYSQADARLSAIKTLTRAEVSLTRAASNQEETNRYIRRLCQTVLEKHDASAQTLVIVNRVERAQALFDYLRSARGNKQDLLIHAQFRAAERTELSRRLREEPGEGRIIVTTQAIEAGVDISSKIMITELAPWPSMVLRFGRCNRYGEHNDTGAYIYWIDIEGDADPIPYTVEMLAEARTNLHVLKSANPDQLPSVPIERALSAVLRRKDLLDLFNTDPDLSGFDVDISGYIRDTCPPGVQIFWRDFKDNPNIPEPQGRSRREELCPASLSQAQNIVRHKDISLWCWDTLDGRWVKLTSDPRPGVILLAQAASGGYDQDIGFNPGLTKMPVPVIEVKTQPEDAFSEDWHSYQKMPVGLADHLGNVADHALRLCTVLGETDFKTSVIRAGRWHDLGKAHPIFDTAMHACPEAPAGFLAKSPCPGRHNRKFFRHELASMLGWLAQHDDEPDANLIAYLILAHHGKVRMSLRAMPTEQANQEVRRFARGVWEDDVLPDLDFDGEHSNKSRLKLGLMEIGKGEQGPSWTERSLKLLEEHGPFRLAWLETLVQLADWRATTAEQQGDGHE